MKTYNLSTSTQHPLAATLVFHASREIRRLTAYPQARDIHQQLFLAYIIVEGHKTHDLSTSSRRLLAAILGFYTTRGVQRLTSYPQARSIHQQLFLASTPVEGYEDLHPIHKCTASISSYSWLLLQQKNRKLTFYPQAHGIHQQLFLASIGVEGYKDLRPIQEHAVSISSHSWLLYQLRDTKTYELSRSTRHLLAAIISIYSGRRIEHLRSIHKHAVSINSYSWLLQWQRNTKTYGLSTSMRHLSVAIFGLYISRGIQTYALSTSTRDVLAAILGFYTSRGIRRLTHYPQARGIYQQPFLASIRVEAQKTYGLSTSTRHPLAAILGFCTSKGIRKLTHYTQARGIHYQLFLASIPVKGYEDSHTIHKHAASISSYSQLV